MVQAERTAPRAPVRIVIADDDPDLRILYRSRASRDPAVDLVGEAASGLEAIEAARLFHPDVVILDLLMPRMDGIPVIPRILEEAPGVKVIAHSSAEHLTGQALDAGAHAFTPKGTPWPELCDLVLRVADTGDGHRPSR